MKEWHERKRKISDAGSLSVLTTALITSAKSATYLASRFLSTSKGHVGLGFGGLFVEKHMLVKRRFQVVPTSHIYHTCCSGMG